MYHYLAGEEGPRRVNDIVGAGRPHESNAPNKRTQDVVEPYAVFKKNNVYLTRTYHVERTGPIDLMMRVSSVGEYFKIVNTMNSCDYRSGYMSCYLDTRIYDEENDKGFTVSVAQALRYCQVKTLFNFEFNYQSSLCFFFFLFFVVIVMFNFSTPPVRSSMQTAARACPTMPSTHTMPRI